MKSLGRSSIVVDAGLETRAFEKVLRAVGETAERVSKRRLEPFPKLRRLVVLLRVVFKDSRGLEGFG